jgi:hypothetical protein
MSKIIVTLICIVALYLVATHNFVEPVIQFFVKLMTPLGSAVLFIPALGVLILGLSCLAASRR